MCIHMAPPFKISLVIRLRSKRRLMKWLLTHSKTKHTQEFKWAVLQFVLCNRAVDFPPREVLLGFIGAPSIDEYNAGRGEI